MEQNLPKIKDLIELNSNALMLRDRLGEDRFSPIQIFNLISNIEHISLVYFPMSTKVSGLCVIAGEEKLIAINSTLTLGRQRFTAAHELYHLFEQEGFKNVVCPSGIGFSKDPEEINADNYASFLLAPFESLRLYIYETLNKKGRILDLRDVISIEQFFGMSHQATLYRLFKEGFISLEQKADFSSGVISVAREFGFDTELYKTFTPDKAKKLTLGSYVSFTKNLVDSGIISFSKADEYLEVAFRDDIVSQRGQETAEDYD